MTTSTIGTGTISSTSRKFPQALSSDAIFKYEEAEKRLPAIQGTLTASVRIKLCLNDPAPSGLTGETHCKCTMGTFAAALSGQ